MSQQYGRYSADASAQATDGWTLERVTSVSHLYGANGLRTGSDGRIYVAQGIGSQISAIDPLTGHIEVISPKGGDIVGPDDVAFDAFGSLYVTEVMDGRVSVRDTSGHTRILRDDLPSANGITFYRNRLFVDECRMGGRLLELDLNGGSPRVLLDNLPMPNALAPGPDGLLYFPLLGSNEIWRVNPDGGAAERVAGDLGVPDAVKFDSRGNIVSTQVHTGEVLCINPRTGERSVLASLDPGLDNLTFVGERLFVSHLTNGRITEILEGETRPLVSGGFNWPLDLAFGDDGQLYVADGFSLHAFCPGQEPHCVGAMFDPGFPRTLRGLAPVGNQCLAVTTMNGQVALYSTETRTHRVLIEGLDQIYGVAVRPGGSTVVAELGSGRVLSVRMGGVEVLAQGLQEPIGVLVDEEGSCIVSEANAGRVVRLIGRRVETVLDGLQCPQGIAKHRGRLYIVDAGAKALISYDMNSKVRSTIAMNLPLGAPIGVVPKPLRGSLPFAGPLGPFAGIAVASDGTLYFSADAEGTVMALRPDDATRSSVR
jgi:sugar lactone lactonase YvrE